MPVRVTVFTLLIALPTLVGLGTPHVAGAEISSEAVDDDFNAPMAIEGYKAEGPGCGGVDVDGSKLDPEVQDRRCAVMNGWRMILEDHGYCLNEERQEWALCPVSK